MVTINRAFRDVYYLTEASQIGLKNRITKGSAFHPMVRRDWVTQDKIRGILGTYKITYAGSKGLQTYNYAAALNQLRDGNLPRAIESRGFRSSPLRTQLQGPNRGTNIIFDYEVISEPFGPSTQERLDCLDQTQIDQILNMGDIGPTIPPGQGCPGTTHAPAMSFKKATAQERPDCLDQTQIDQILNMGGTVPKGRGCPGTTHAPPMSFRDAKVSVSSPAGPQQEFLKLTYDIEEQSTWNAYSNRSNASTNFLSNVDTMTRFLSGSTSIGPLLLHQFAGLLNGMVGSSLTDHTTVLRLASQNINIRASSGYNLHVEPVYNYYASTTPPYEVVIGLPGRGKSAPTAPSIKEYHLPNVYYLQSELNNTSSTLLAQYHLPSLTLDQNIPWFNIGNQQNVTEANVDRYYDLYAEGITSLKADSVLYGIVDASLNFNNRNFVVLHSDLDAIKEDRINTTTIPFYNKLTLGYDLDGRGGKNAGVSILRNLYNDDETRDFVNILQMQTVLRLTTEASGATEMTFMQTHKRVNNSEDPTDFSNTSGIKNITVLYDLEDLFANYLSTNREIEIASIINNFATFDPDVQYIGMDLEQLPFRLIRDYNLSPDQLDADPVHVENAYVEMYEDENSPSNLTRVVRSYEEMIGGISCHTETLMYIVKKKLTPSAPPVQTFYISAEFSNDAPTVFFDTQVKYDTNYYYDIDRVVLVFGNEYEYHGDPQVKGGTNILGLPITSKIRIDNRPSVRALVVPYISGEGYMSAKIMDKPPVPPEVTFYPYKGINNKLKILLNSSTGKLEATPVVIEEGDEEYFLGEYRAQGAEWSTTYDELIAAGDKLSFRSDDPVDAYEIFRLATKPESYQSFAGNSVFLDPARGVPGAILDTILPNTKYYYCARAIDVHGNRSNPTHIYELEMVDNNGQIFLKQGVIRYEAPKQNFIKPGRRFVYIEPTFRQLIFPYGTDTGPPAVDTPPLSSILGDAGIDKVWGKTFKVRVKSNKTGRKVDLNLTFKNSGIVNASE